MQGLDPGGLKGVYKEFANHFGLEIAIMVHYHFKGLQITFPQRLLAKEYVQSQILKEYDGTNSKEQARKYNYTERVIKGWLTKDPNISGKGPREK